MLKVMVAAGLMSGLLMLGACASHQNDSGKLKAQIVNGGGSDNGSGKRICVREAQNGTHIAQSYCMTPEQYKQYVKAQQQSQEMFQRKNESTAHPKGCSGPSC